MPTIRFAIAILTLTLAGSSALGQSTPAERVSQADLEFFEKKVRPVLAAKCYACHSTGAREKKKLRGGLLLDSRAGLGEGGDSGPAVVPGQPAKSLLIEAVRYTNPDLQMPPEGKLAAGEIAVLEAWVKRGAPFPGSGAASGRNIRSTLPRDGGSGPSNRCGPRLFGSIVTPPGRDNGSTLSSWPGWNNAGWLLRRGPTAAHSSAG